MVKRWASLLCGALILALVPTGTLAVASSKTVSNLVPPASVIAAVTAGQSVVTLPADATPSLPLLASSPIDSVDWGGDVQNGTKCVTPTPTNASGENYKDCYFGDLRAKITVALLGDSRASMVLDDMNYLGIHEGFRVLYVAKSGCPTPSLPYTPDSSSKLWTGCITFHSTMLSVMHKVKPKVILISSSWRGDLAQPSPHWATRADIEFGLEKFLSKLPKASRTLVLGGFPQPFPPLNPDVCLTRNMTNVQMCAYAPPSASVQENAGARAATLNEHDTYLNLMPYFCAATCPPVINNIIPYTDDGFHAGKTYMTYLTGTLWSMLKPALSASK